MPRQNSETKVRPPGVTFENSVNVEALQIYAIVELALPEIPGKCEGSENEERGMKLERRTSVGSDAGVGNVGEAEGGTYLGKCREEKRREEKNRESGGDKEEEVFKLLGKSGNVSTWPEALPTELKLLKSMAQKSVVAGAAESILLDESNNIPKVDKTAIE
ncbi:hypothetical protein V1478_002319 [Vespula squamosa]|uniref:Uncharacterized protein n=1 Tax=Vespula squamosa TaxID=30214 RepID=A0ABD2BVZ1_VESSQ